MKNRYRFPILFICCLLISFGCDEVFQEDISTEEISFVAPYNNFISPSNNVRFDWMSIDFAAGYKIQVVEPDFTSIGQVIFDSVVTDPTVTFAFTPGFYAAKVQGINNISQTDFAYVSFQVDSSASLEDFQVNLELPDNHSFITDGSVQFIWSPVTNANAYRFELYTSNEVLVESDVVNSTSQNVDLVADDSYTWRVQALNDFSATPFSQHIFTLDKTFPAPPVLLSPENNSQVPSSTPVVFTWEEAIDASPIEQYEIAISTDQGFSSLLENFPQNTDSLNLTISLGIGTYYWKVSAEDAAGNQSEYSTSRKVNVQF